jgi:hypothetical protein
MSNQVEISKTRLILGGVILVVGFMSPLLIPLVTATDWGIGIKATLSGLLAFGIPEVFMLIAVAVLGKQGYEFLKGIAFKFLKRFAPSDSVSLVRYRIGLVLFSFPLLVGWTQPYLGHYFSFIQELPLWFSAIGDLMLFSSFFVLGGDFWDKFSGLFKHNVKIAKHS